MKLLAFCFSFLTWSIESASAADHSVVATPDGINLYEIRKEGALLVAGSPFTIPPIAGTILTPVVTVMNPAHDFVYVLFENLAYKSGGANQPVLAGFSVTDRGLAKQWEFSPGNANPEIYAQDITTVEAGPDYVVFTYAPDDSTPFSSYLIAKNGHTIAEQSGQTNENQPIYWRVAPDDQFLYLCQYVGNIYPLSEKVSVYSAHTGLFERQKVDVGSNPVVLFSSTEPTFVASVCSSPTFKTPP